MTDDRTPAASDEEVISAYLAGDLDDADAAAVEQRLAVDLALRARVDALAEALVVLGGVDEHEPPEGFDARLADRLAAERAAPVTDLAARRAQRRRSSLWLGVGTAAAVVALGAVMAGSLLRGGGMGAVSGGGAESADTAAAGSSESAAALQQQSDQFDAPVAPVVLDRNVAVASDEALQRRYSDLPEARELLGVDVAEAERIAADFTAIVDERSNARSATRSLEGTAATGAAGAGGGASTDAQGGTDEAGAAQGEDQEDNASAVPAPETGTRREELNDPCLAEIVASADAPLVPVRVETLRYRGSRAVAYVFVTAEPGAPRLDRTEVWIVRPAGCREVTFLQY